MKLPWVEDPKTKELSVTLTLVVLSAITMVAAIGLELAGKAKGTSLITDFFWGSLATYVGRRFNIGAKSFGGDATSTEKKKNEEA